jgi:hypothetical protein
LKIESVHSLRISDKVSVIQQKNGEVLVVIRTDDKKRGIIISPTHVTDLVEGRTRSLALDNLERGMMVLDRNPEVLVIHVDGRKETCPKNDLISASRIALFAKQSYDLGKSTELVKLSPEALPC